MVCVIKSDVSRRMPAFQKTITIIEPVRSSHGAKFVCSKCAKLACLNGIAAADTKRVCGGKVVGAALCLLCPERWQDRPMARPA